MPSCHAFELVANIVLMQKVKDLKARNWYMIQSLKNGWGRNFLIEAINQDYYHAYGALAHNLDTTLSEIQAKQVKETIRPSGYNP